MNCSSDLKNFEIFFSRLLEQFFLTVGQNNFGNKIPFFVTSAGDFLLRLGVAEQDGRVLDTRLGAWLPLSIVVPLPGVCKM